MVDKGWGVTHPGFMSVHWRGEPRCGECGCPLSLQAPTSDHFSRCQNDRGTMEVSPVFKAPPSPVGSSSGCPRSALLSCAFKGADIFGSLVTICEMVSVSLSLSISWALVERQRWYNRLKGQQGEVFTGIPEGLRSLFS